MAHDLMLDSFESLWHYGGGLSPSLSAASRISFSTAPTRTPPPIPTQRIIPCCSAPRSLANHVVAGQARSLESLFAVMDEDGDGRLSVREMSSHLTKLGITSHSPDNLFSLFNSTLYPNQPDQQTTSSNTGAGLDPSLDFPQFVQLYAALFSSAGPSPQTPATLDDGAFEDELLDAFRVYDTNRDGFISAAELSAVLHDLGLLPATAGDMDAHLATCQAYIDSVDLDGNGVVDLREFKAMMSIHNSPSPLCCCVSSA